MNLLPNIPGTAANWPLQTNLLDTSGHGLDLMTVDWGTPGTAIVHGGVEQYDTVGPGVSGFKFNGATKLVAPLTPLLQLPGPYTIQFILNQASGLGGNQVYAVCADPTRFGGLGGGANLAPASLYSWFYSRDFLGNLPYYDDGTHTSILAGCFPPTINPFAPPTDWGITVTALYTLRHNADHTLDMFYNSTRRPCSLVNTAVGVSNGAERFWIGGCDSTFNDAISSGSVMAGYRVLNYPRPDADVGVDATYIASPAGTPYPTPESSGGNIIYDGLAAAQYAQALRQAPRS